MTARDATDNEHVDPPPSDEPSMPLALVEPGRRVRVSAIHAGRGMQSRLASLGIRKGTELQVISNSRNGPFIVAIQDFRVILGRGMIHRIKVC